MPESITDLLERAVDDLDAREDLAARVIRRVRRKRRATSLGAAMAIAALAVTGGVLMARGTPDRAVISAAPPAPAAKVTPSVTVLDSFGGVDVTYLPPGLVAHQNRNLYTQDGHQALSQSYGQPPTAPVANGIPHQITLLVQRGYVADLAAITPDYGFTTQSVTVRGHPAVLETGGPINPGEGDRYVLIWVEDNALTLTLTSEAGVTAAQVLKTAEGLIVHPAPAGPADVEAATAAVKSAVHNVFTGGQPDATTLDSLTNGEQLASTLSYLKAHSTEIVNSARVTVSSVTFLDATTALALINIDYTSGGQPQGWGQQTTVSLTDGQWKVTNDSYCVTVGSLLPSCPVN